MMSSTKATRRSGSMPARVLVSVDDHLSKVLAAGAATLTWGAPEPTTGHLSNHMDEKRSSYRVTLVYCRGRLHGQ